MRAWIGIGAAALAAWCCMLLPQPAYAQAPPEDASYPEARAVFLQATALYENGSYARAELEFRRAWELMEGHPRRSLVQINIARCVEAQSGREREALALYQEALAATEAMVDDSGIRDARQIAHDRVAELNARLAAVDRGEEPAASDGSASAPDLTAPIVLMAGGGAALLAGIGTGIGTALEHDQLVDACPDKTCAPDEAGRIDSVRALGIATDVLLGVGGAVATAGLVWLIVELATGDAAEAPVTASCGPDGCSFALRGEL